MAGQSLAMGEAFGKGFQYGKRKISSMSNEEFNALNFQQLSESIATDYKTMIPSLKKSIEASDELQRAVFKALGDLLLDIPESIKSFFQDAASTTTSQTSLTSASQLGEIYNVRSGGRDVNVNQEAIDAAQKIIDQAVLDAKALLSPFNAGSQQDKVNREAQRKQAALEAAARARTANEAKFKTEEKKFTKALSRSAVITSRRKAGANQIYERNLMIQKISRLGKDMAAGLRAGHKSSSSFIASKQTEIRGLQVQLTNLLKRYSF